MQWNVYYHFAKSEKIPYKLLFVDANVLPLSRVLYLLDAKDTKTRSRLYEWLSVKKKKINKVVKDNQKLMQNIFF